MYRELHSFGKNIKKYRHIAGLRQEDLADYVIAAPVISVRLNMQERFQV